MQNLFNRTVGTEYYESAIRTMMRGSSSVWRSFGEKFTGSTASDNQVDGVVLASMRNSTSPKAVEQKDNDRDEAWLSGIAYRALSNWHYNKLKESSPILGFNTHSPVKSEAAAPDGTHTTDRQLQLIRAMVAAARSDGEMGATERIRILKTIEEMSVLPEVKATFVELLDQPVTADCLASSTDDIEWKAEIYLASCLTMDSYNRSQRMYLDQLESVLYLPDGLAEKLQWHAQRAKRLT